MHTNEGRGKSISHILPEMTVLNRSVQFSPSVSDSLRPQHTKRSIHHQLPESTQPMSIVSVMPSNHLILCCHLLLPSIFPNIRVFSTELALCIRWLKYWSFICLTIASCAV